MGNQCMDPKLKERSCQDYELCIRVETWNKEAHNLFDHSSDKLKREELLSLSASALLVKHENTLKLVNSLAQYRALQSGRLDFIIDVLRTQHEYRLLRQTVNDQGLSLRNLWRVVGKQKVQLSQGDIIKLGRLRFLVEELAVGDMPSSSVNPQEETQLEFHSACKICYQKSYTVDNPLISPCGCTGSIQYIHLGCLRQWLEKLSEVKRTDWSLSIPCSTHNCQLCHEPIKQDIVVGDAKHNTYHRPIKMQPPYIKLTLLSKDSNKPKALHYFSFSEKASTFIGRSSSAGIRVTDDISISRQHSQLTYDERRFYISDFKSKFGTLQLIRSPLRFRDTAFSALQMSNNRILQICNHVLRVQLRPVNRDPNVQQLKRSQMQVQMILAEARKQVIEEESVPSADQSVVQFDVDD